MVSVRGPRRADACAGAAAAGGPRACKLGPSLGGAWAGARLLSGRGGEGLRRACCAGSCGPTRAHPGALRGNVGACLRAHGAGWGSAGKRGRVSVMAPRPPGGPGLRGRRGARGPRGGPGFSVLPPPTRPEAERTAAPGSRAGRSGPCPRWAASSAPEHPPRGAGPALDAVRPGGARCSAGSRSCLLPLRSALGTPPPGPEKVGP